MHLHVCCLTMETAEEKGKMFSVKLIGSENDMISYALLYHFPGIKCSPTFTLVSENNVYHTM